MPDVYIKNINCPNCNSSKIIRASVSVWLKCEDCLYVFD
jgi:ribosomal protein L37AE/L43A